MHARRIPRFRFGRCQRSRIGKTGLQTRALTGVEDADIQATFAQLPGCGNAGEAGTNDEHILAHFGKLQNPEYILVFELRDDTAKSKA